MIVLAIGAQVLAHDGAVDSPADRWTRRRENSAARWSEGRSHRVAEALKDFPPYPA